jgi:hypothetical protein
MKSHFDGEFHDGFERGQHREHGRRRPHDYDRREWKRATSYDDEYEAETRDSTRQPQSTED